MSLRAAQAAEEIEGKGYYRGLTRRAARASRLVLALVAAVSVVLAGIVGRGYYLERQWRNAYAVVRRGDSRAQVTQLMGSAGDTVDCSSAPTWDGVRIEDSGVRCAAAVSYIPVPFFEGWLFEFDARDRVISKNFWVFD